jgi:3-hydroxyacyl-CoA dehydrogenase/enoyl-CoA hydratase/3-hydroxybutyryl-CoA epimerase/enoyl-CoA isomerase
MIYQGKAIQVSMLDQELAEFKFDLQGDSVNKFNQLTIKEFKEAIAALVSQSGIAGLLVTSGKDVFIVGADITEFSALFSEPEEKIAESCLEINKIFCDFEDLPFPTVCAINGVALGGGLELALACDYRVMSSKTIIGLPEVKLGINPGFGGTVRLPRLIGIDNAVEWVCTGKDYKADAALAAGTVDAVVDSAQLRAASESLLRDCIAGKFDFQSRREEKKSPVKLNDIERMMAFITGKAVVAAQAGSDMPAPISAAKSMEKSAGLVREEALKIEGKFFARLAKTDVADSLVGLFLNEQDLSKRAKEYAGNAQSVKKAAVLGAGIMGGGIAYQSAYKGIPVNMKDIAEAGLKQGLDEAAKLLSKRVDRGRMSSMQMASVLNDIRATLDYTGFDKIDFVVEAVVENPKVKKAVLAECEQTLPPQAILASNTSTISITSLAEGLQRPENFCGMHFFNPVHRMPLVEVIRGEKSSDSAIATTVTYARNIGKTPIVVNDCPGFYVNRVLFPYFAGFDLLLREGADYQQVDRVMEKFGWPMGPAYLLDVVGIDTARHAAAVMAEGYPDRMKPDFKGVTELMFEANRFGQKNGKGFYLYEEDKKGRPQKSIDPEVNTILAQVIKGSTTFSDEEIIARMMIPMCIEVVRCLEEGIVQSPGDADLGLIMGLGFPLFRGGPVRYMDAMGVSEFCKLASGYTHLGALYQPTEKLMTMGAENAKFFS